MRLLLATWWRWGHAGRWLRRPLWHAIGAWLTRLGWRLLLEVLLLLLLLSEHGGGIVEETRLRTGHGAWKLLVRRWRSLTGRSALTSGHTLLPRTWRRAGPWHRRHSWEALRRTGQARGRLLLLKLLLLIIGATGWRLLLLLLLLLLLFDHHLTRRLLHCHEAFSCLLGSDTTGCDQVLELDHLLMQIRGEVGWCDLSGAPG